MRKAQFALALVLAWISVNPTKEKNDHMPSKVWDEITYPSKISTATPLKCNNG